MTPAARTQQQHGGLRRDERADDGNEALQARDRRTGRTLPSHAPPPRHAGRRPLRHPRQSPCPRGGASRRLRDRGARDLVPRRPRRLRRGPERLRAPGAATHATVCLAGNHDLGVTGALPLHEFSPGAALAARWTQEVIDPECLAWLSPWSPPATAADVGLFHGSPRDPIWEYVMSVLLADLCFDAFEERIGLIGHSHVACSFERPRGRARDGLAAPRRRGASTSRPGAGSSTPAASASRATATRARPGCCSTSTAGTAAWRRIGLRRRRRGARSAPPGCRTRSPSASSTVSDDAPLPR